MTGKTLLTTLAAGCALTAGAEVVAHFDMTVNDGRITETVSGKSYAVEGHFAPENVDGAVGKALRFDGYTSRVNAAIGGVIPAGSKQLTASVWVAMPSYPIIQIDTDTSEQTPIVSCLDETAKTGFGFYIGFNDRWSFRTYVGGWPLTVTADAPLPAYEWCNLTAVVDCDARTARLYNNGVEVGSGRASGTLTVGESALYFGQGTESRMSGPFELMSFNGLIDDLTVRNDAASQEEIAGWQAENAPDLDIPASRFADDLLRPRFHAMPVAAWTNECHGMWFADGRYHLFFQKNADGPYMARLHWGHISSENLCEWREERIALAPGEPYDIKGCWSGCVFADDVVTGGKPGIIYTAVDYAKATIAQASPLDDQLDVWEKAPGNPIIGGRPSGLSDDFRDPYFFRNGDNAYIIVGSSKGGVGTTTLHRYNAVSGMWSNDGDLFFTGTSAARDGRFWEMPNVTPLGDGRWLFTATPLGTSQGVRTLYWTGNIDASGHFNPDSHSAEPRLLEMNSREGFGLLSPTVYSHDGRIIALGIVPDKLPAQTNWNLGWAHCFSLPREWTVDADGVLRQKPCAELAGMRGEEHFSRRAFVMSGSVGLSPVAGRAAEIIGEFEVGTAAFGFNLFKSEGSEATVRYEPSTGELVADFSNLRRLTNDNGVYDGVYRCPLPERPAVGSTLKINLFVDHSILDIFVNDRWATSIRVFPSEAGADGIEAFADGAVNVVALDAWTLDARAAGSSVGDIFADETADADPFVDVVSISGQLLRKGISRATALDGLPRGIYIVGHEKVAVR